MRHAFMMAFPGRMGAFPFVTFAENVVGSFLLGVVLISLLRAPAIGARWRPFLATGVLGSFTTFSNVSVQFVQMAAHGATLTAVLYLSLSIVLGLSAAAAGIGLGAGLTRRFRNPG
jgi:CrcB protein